MLEFVFFMLIYFLSEILSYSRDCFDAMYGCKMVSYVCKKAILYKYFFDYSKIQRYIKPLRFLLFQDI